MDNFTYSTEIIKGTTYHVYTCDAATKGLYNLTPGGMSYAGTWHTGLPEEKPLTWPKYLETIAELVGKYHMSAILGATGKVICNAELDASEETALDDAYDNHVAPTSI